MISRDVLASVTLVLTTVAITILAIITIVRDPSEAKDILNVILPVFASWVGTVLAFQGFNFGLNQGFVVVSEKTSLSEAKIKYLIGIFNH